MNYFSGHWGRLSPQLPFIDNDFLAFDKPADTIAIAVYSNCYADHTISVNHLLKKCKHLHVYLNEPTGNDDHLNLSNFLKDNDLPNITFYSDCVLNFKLHHAKFITQICWFIDEFNYYVSTNWGKESLRSLEYNYSKPYKFDMLLGSQRAHRDFVYSSYQRSELLKNNVITTYYKDNMNQGLWPDWADPTQQNCLFSGDLFTVNNEPIRSSAVIPVDIYNQSYYSIVAETTFFNEYNHYTEKIAKPIVALRPFIVFAGQHYLKNLKSIGFKTFDLIIDESYDSIADNYDRWSAAIYQIKSLCLKDPKLVLSTLREVLEHNKNHFLTTDWMQPAKNLIVQHQYALK